MTQQQSKHIQILRGIAIAAVVLIHTMPGGAWQIYLRPFVNFAVGLFLFLSGLLSNARQWKPKKRLMKVLVPYAVWTLIYTAMYNSENLAQIPLRFLKNLITAEAAGMLYYIPVYCTFTLLIPCIDRLSRSKFRYLGFWIAPLEIFVVYMLPNFLNRQLAPVQFLQSVPWGWLLYYYLGWFTYFYLGYLLGNGYIRLRKRVTTWACLWAVSLPIQMFEAAWLASGISTNPGTQMKMSALLTGTFFVLMAYRFIFSEKEYTCKPLEYLGDRAFGIYFSHIAVMAVLRKIPYYRTVAVFPLNTIVVIFVSMLCILLGKRLLGKYAKYLGL